MNQGDNWIFLGVALGVMWLAQFGLSYLQMKRYYGRVAKLRRTGLCATGMSGDRLRTRAYVVLVLDESRRVKNAENLSGITVFASLKPVPQLLGLHIHDITPESAPPKGVSGKLWTAFCSAADHLRAHLAKSAVPAPESTGTPDTQEALIQPS